MFRTKEEHLNYFRHVARTEWFKNHEVALSEFTDGKNVIRVVRFYQPKTIYYAVRYVFDGNHIYVSGDLGCAIFECTWTPLPTDKTPSFWYLFEKCHAFEGNLWDFDSYVCKSVLRDTLLEPGKGGNHTVYPEKWDDNPDAVHTFRALLRRANDASTTEQWAHVMKEIDVEEGSLSIVDNDYWEWMYGAGNVMPPCMIGILTGLQMVSEELNKRKEKENNKNGN